MLFRRAGFSLSRACSEKCVGPLPGAADPIFPEKNGDLFWSSLSLLFTRSLGCRPFAVAKNWPLLRWGPFLWGPLFGRTC